MDSSGHLKYLQSLTNKEIQAVIDNGFKPVNKENQAQAGMLLKGEKETRVDPKVFASWTSKRKRKHLQQKMSKKNR